MGSLSGITVVDFTRQLPGPFASRELLRLGARVVKVEPPEGDPMPEGWYQALNDGKEVVSWEARTEPPPEALAVADVVLEGFRPGVWERLALDVPATTILCSITGYGTSGPRRQDAGHDLNYLGYAGALADTAPSVPPVQIADLAAGAQGAVIEVLAALLERERTGRGARIVISMTHASHRFVSHRLAGDPVPRLLTGGVACYRIYETADGRHLTVAALEPKFWRNLCTLLDRPELVDRAYEPSLPELEELFRSRTLHDWRAALEGKDTCVGPVLTLAEAADELAVKELAALAFALFGIHVGAHRVLPIGYAPAWSPDGQRIAFVTRGDLWVADADGTHRGKLVDDADQPAWSPNGRRLAFERDASVWTVRADGLDERRLARGAHPAWSPDGERIAFDRDGEVITVRWHGGDAHAAGVGEDPAYGPSGQLAVVQEGEIVVRGNVIASGTEPAWSPAGKLAWVSGTTIYVEGHAVHAGQQPAWRPAARVRELLPDFDQRAPTGLTVAGGPGRWLLGFTSLVDNVGLGPSELVGVRKPGQKRMIGTQLVRLANRKVRTYGDVARFRYTNSPPHHHWHLMRFDSFELRTLVGQTLVRDRKSGFCLADHWGAAPGIWPGRRPHFLGDCAQYRPKATRVVMGTTPGYTDRYPAFFHGQNVDITKVPAGVYDLLHRANASMQLHELRYDNDAASVRLRLTWRKGYPSVRILRSCPATADC